MRGGRRLREVVLLLIVVCLVLPGTPSTWALFSGSSASDPNVLTAARIASATGATLTATQVNGAVHLSWTSVLLDDSRLTSSRIVRTGTDGSVVEVCTGANAPVQIGSTETCTDSAALLDVGYSYTHQPVLRTGGVVTWSVPTGPSTAVVRVPRLSYGGVGPLATVIGGSPVTVQYPSQTAVGDVLVLVVRSGRNKSATTPTGWTTLVSLGGPAPAGDLLVAWRIADSASSVTVSTNTNGSGVAVQIARYVRAAGYTGTPQSAVVTPLSGSAAPSASWTMPGTISVTANNSTVVSIATVVSANTLSITSDPKFTFRSTTAATIQNNGFAVGFADAVSVDTGLSISAPTWEQSGTAGGWMAALVAFA